jgi:hypothetical protein
MPSTPDISDPAASDRLERSVNRLSIAIWVLIILVAANLVIALLALFSPALLTKRTMAALPEQFASSESLRPDEYNSFHDWPVEKQIASASVIAIARWQKSDSTLKCFISEIVKQTPNTTFYYKVGDEFRQSNRRLENNTSYGDGEIMFFTGSPASFRFSTTLKDDRIIGMDDMPLTELRELIRKSKQ